MTMISAKEIGQALKNTARELNLFFMPNNKRKMNHIPMKRKKFLKYPNDIIIVRGRRLTDVESLNLIRGNDFDTTLLSKMEVDGFEFKNGEYLMPFIDVYESSEIMK